ncbi:MAG: hypothetical protein AAGA47_01355 [Pseudomonadota bacterium]
MLSKTTMRLARALLFVTALLFFALVGTGIWLMGYPAQAMTVFAETLSPDDAISPAAFRALSFAWLVMLGLGLLLLWHMGALFRAFAQGDTLAPTVLRHVAGAGWALIAIVLYRLLLRPIEGLTRALFPAPDAPDRMTISFSSQDVTMLLGGVLLLMLARVLLEASRAAEENRAFV